MIDTQQLVIGALLALVVAGASWRLRMLSSSGAVATSVLGTIVFGLGGWMWSLPLVTFFVLSSLLSRLGTRGSGSGSDAGPASARGTGGDAAAKERFEEIFEKGSRRDAGQVIANGGVAGALVIVSLFSSRWTVDNGLFAAYVGALAAAAADTWGTEIGVLGRGRVVSLATLRTVPAGTSGGVSLVGTLGAIVGALSVSLSAIPWVSDAWMLLGVGLVSGMVGMVVDSLAGSLLQARYRCDVCGLDTERSEHCGREARHVGGRKTVGNDVVNLICCFAGAITALLLAVAMT